MMLHVENTEDATRKLLEFISESGKVTGYKITFLYTNNERSERDINETIPFIIV